VMPPGTMAGTSWLSTHGAERTLPQRGGAPRPVMSTPVVGLRSKRSRLTTAVLVVLVLALLGLTLRLFVYPDLNAPERSDAIAVLGGNGDGPDRTGLELARQGYAPTVVFSINPSQSCDEFRAALPHLRVICFLPRPNTTQGEAQAIGRLADAAGWRRIIVVMPTTQATRARLRVGWCYPGQVLEVASPPPGFAGWVRGIAYEWGALIKAFVLTDGC